MPQTTRKSDRERGSEYFTVKYTQMQPEYIQPYSNCDKSMAKEYNLQQETDKILSKDNVLSCTLDVPTYTQKETMKTEW